MRLLNPGYESKTINNSLYWNSESGNCYNAQNNVIDSCNFTNTGLSNDSKAMIENAIWYTGAGMTDGMTTIESYKQERGIGTGSEDIGIIITKTTNWIGKVGLMYPSDYGYASSECYTNEVFYQENEIDYRQEKCINSNWLYNTAYQWTLTPRTDLRYNVLRVNSAGYIGNNYAGVWVSVRPAVYLSSSVKITGGTGTIDDMYELSL